MNQTQSELFEKPKEATAQVTMVKCQECQTEFVPGNSIKPRRFCTDRCRQRARDRDKKLNGPKMNTDNEINDDDMEVSTTTRRRKPQSSAAVNAPPMEHPMRPITLKGVEEPTALVIALYKREAERAEAAYAKAVAKLEKVTEERDQLQKDIVTMRFDHKDKLNGVAIEAAKPDFLDRIAGLPPQLLEGFTPLMHKLASYLPDGNAAPSMAGPGGDLTQDQLALLEWISNLPANEAEIFLGIVSSLMTMDVAKRASTLSQIMNVLKTGSTLNGVPGQSAGRDNRMYAN